MKTLQATFTDILNKFSRAFEDLTRVDHVRSQSHLKSLVCFVKAGTKSSAEAEGISNRGLCGRTMHGLWWDHAHWSESLATVRNTVPGQHFHRRQKAKSWANRQHGKQSIEWIPLKKFWSFLVFSEDGIKKKNQQTQRHDCRKTMS